MNKNVVGYILGFLASMVATIPWFLIFYYGGWLIALLATPIAISALWTFRKMGGNVTKITPYIIAIETLLSLSIMMFVVVPLFDLAKEGLPVTFNSLLLNVYPNSEYMSYIITNSGLTYLFAILGIVGIITQLKNEVNPELVIKKEKKKEESQDIKDEIYQFFLEKDAFSKKNTISGDEMNSFITDKERKKLFGVLCGFGIIKKYRGRYFYEEKNEKNFMPEVITNYKKNFIIVLIILLLFMFFALLF